jgi:hypothetical protein
MFLASFAKSRNLFDQTSPINNCCCDRPADRGHHTPCQQDGRSFGTRRSHKDKTLEQQEYEREKIGWTFVDYGMDSQDCIDLIEKKPMGILPLLDEQTVFPDADHTSYTKKLFNVIPSNAWD